MNQRKIKSADPQLCLDPRTVHSFCKPQTARSFSSLKPLNRKSHTDSVEGVSITNLSGKYSYSTQGSPTLEKDLTSQNTQSRFIELSSRYQVSNYDSKNKDMNDDLPEAKQNRNMKISSRSTDNISSSKKKDIQFSSFRGNLFTQNREANQDNKNWDANNDYRNRDANHYNKNRDANLDNNNRDANYENKNRKANLDNKNRDGNLNNKKSYEVEAVNSSNEEAISTNSGSRKYLPANRIHSPAPCQPAKRNAIRYYKSKYLNWK